MHSATVSDFVTPFMIDHADVRGRLVRLSDIAHTILTRYDYPAPVARMLGELLVVAAMLGSNLKQDGIFTLQIRGKGLVPLMVVDAAYGGELRGFAEMPGGSAQAIAALTNPTPRDLFGQDAYLAITLDPGEDMQRYQGVVALEGESLTDAIAHYFTYSQQVDVLFRLAVDKVAPAKTGETRWVASGMMVEKLPPEAAKASDAEREEGWRYTTAIVSTVKDGELTDPLLDAPSLLYRLFHEEGVWVQDALGVGANCRCSRDRIEKLLLSMPMEDRADMVVDGEVSVHCQFCNTTQRFTPEEIGLAAEQ